MVPSAPFHRRRNWGLAFKKLNRATNLYFSSKFSWHCYLTVHPLTQCIQSKLSFPSTCYSWSRSYFMGAVPRPQSPQITVYLPSHALHPATDRFSSQVPLILPPKCLLYSLLPPDFEGWTGLDAPASLLRTLTTVALYICSREPLVSASIT